MIAFQAMFPVVVVPDLASLKEFYVSAFGFESVFYDPSFYLHLVSPASGVQLGFLMQNHPSQPDFLHTKMAAEGFVVSFEVQNAANAFAEANAMNLTIVMPIKEEEWGQIHFMVEDPAGMRIDIVEHIEQPEQ